MRIILFSFDVVLGCFVDFLSSRLGNWFFYMGEEGRSRGYFYYWAERAAGAGTRPGPVASRFGKSWTLRWGFL